MRKNLTQTGTRATNGRIYIEYDWYQKGIPGNVQFDENVFMDTSYGFSMFCSLLPNAMKIEKGSGCYDRASFITGPDARIEIGAFNILNGSTFICHEHIKTGDHCMFAWGAVITDSWIDHATITREQKRVLLSNASNDSNHILPTNSTSKAIIIEDNVWVGFDAVILPGSKLGRGCIVGSKSVINEIVPPYAVVVGNPARIIRYLDEDDTPEARSLAMKEYVAQGYSGEG